MGVSVYPNPAKNIINVVSKKSKKNSPSQFSDKEKENPQEVAKRKSGESLESPSKGGDSNITGTGSVSRFNELFEKYRQIRENKHLETSRQSGDNPVGILKNSKERESSSLSKSQDPEQKKRKNVQFLEEKFVPHTK